VNGMVDIFLMEALALSHSPRLGSFPAPFHL
jgi:hypothetical protein